MVTLCSRSDRAGEVSCRRKWGPARQSCGHLEASAVWASGWQCYVGAWRSVLWVHGAQSCGHLEGQCRDVPEESVEESSTHAPCWVNLACC